MSRLRIGRAPGAGRPRRWLVAALAVAAAAAALPAATGGAASAEESTVPTPVLTAQPPGPVVTRVSTFNVLGASHTAPGGDRKGWADGETRMRWAVRLIRDNALDVVGFQEMQLPQFRVFRDRATEFRIYPGKQFGTAAMANSIAWRRADWLPVETRMIPVPYFDGNIIRKPLVLLQHRLTGQQVWVFNTHNPSDTHGPAQRWRDEAVRIQIDLVNDLRAAAPDVPVLFTGDMNDREKFFCPITAKTELRAANGGSNVDGECLPPVPTKIDWILGTTDVAWTGYTMLDRGLVRRTTDHPLFWADTVIANPVVQAAGVRRVVVLDVEGLTSETLAAATDRTPNLDRMMAEGVSTLNARTTTERTTPLPNVVSMLTGRRVAADEGGHGVGVNRDTGGTVHDAAGRYVSSAFDIVHNHGRHTALFSSEPRMAVVERSWDAAHGGADPYGVDDGRAKIDRVVRVADDTAVVDRLTRMLVRAPKALSVAQLSGAAEAGRTFGWGTTRYRARVGDVDALVGRVLDTVASHPRLAGSTLVVLTADSGGSGTSSTDRTDPDNFTVPLVVWGSTVPAGADLYALNPAYGDPGTARVGYTAVPPMRNGLVANLVTAVLGLPPVPGSQLGAAQDLNLFVTE